ncbi:MAG: ABC transporter substrate-binding protein, partial [Planctomycetaceae bacterium]
QEAIWNERSESKMKSPTCFRTAMAAVLVLSVAIASGCGGGNTSGGKASGNGSGDNLVGGAATEPDQAGLSGDAQTLVRVGYLPVSTTLPTWIAEAQGCATSRGLRLEHKRFATADLLLAALLNGEIHATSVCADEPMLLALHKNRGAFEIYLQEILDERPVFDAILVKGDARAKSLADLAGQTIACFPGTQLRTYLAVILSKAGLDPETVTIRQMPPEKLLPALSSGTVDAIFTLEPYITIGTEQAAARVLTPSPIVKYIGGGAPICAASFLVSTQWADANPAAADSFVAAVQQAVQIIEDDYEACAARYPEFTPIPAELATHVAITRFASFQNPDRSGLKRESETLVQSGTLESSPDLSRVFYQPRGTAE